MSGAALDPAALVALRHVAGRDRGRGPVTALPGGQVTRQRGPGLETMEIRPFADGDDPRHVDRNATARAGRPQVRVFHAEKDRATLLIADFRPSMLWGTRRVFRSVAAAERLALIGWRAAEAGARVGLVAATADGLFHTPPRPRDRGVIAVIGEMARAHAAAIEAATRQPGAPDPPLGDALLAAARLAPKGAEATLASALDAPGPGFETAVLLLARRAALTIERIADAFETAPPPGLYRVRAPDGAIRAAAAAPVTAGSAEAEATLAHLRIPVRWRDAALDPRASDRPD